MKRYLLILLACLAAVVSASAQSGRAVARLFTPEFCQKPEVESVILDGSMLKMTSLDAYRSISTTDAASIKQMEQLVRLDAQKASSKMLKNSGGHLAYAILSYDLSDKQFAYIIFKQFKYNGKDKAVLVYIESGDSLDVIQRDVLQK